MCREKENKAVVDIVHCKSSNILAFDGVAFVKAVAEEALKLHAVSPTLATEYLVSVTGVSIRMDGCLAVDINYPRY